MSQSLEGKREERSQVLITKQTDAATPVHQSLTQPMSSYGDLYDRIAKRAYELYAERGYQHGYDLDDWLKAEREIQEQLRSS